VEEEEEEEEEEKEQEQEQQVENEGGRWQHFEQRGSECFDWPGCALDKTL
jgi:hypothetical protein